MLFENALELQNFEWGPYIVTTLIVGETRVRTFVGERYVSF
jgi:hypothetical protein